MNQEFENQNKQIHVEWMGFVLLLLLLLLLVLLLFCY